MSTRMSASGMDLGRSQNRSAVQSGTHLLQLGGLLFLVQGYHRIYLAGPPRGDDRRRECHRG
jgi:hypothetical protein